jgi:hypothetical protein
MNPFEGEIKQIKEKEIYYYLLPEGLHLFKATTMYNEKQDKIVLNPKGFYFFGVKNMDSSYIHNYEELYGVIHEFKTTRQYKLLAMDNADTRKFLYENASKKKNESIQKILKNNYGYNSGIRDSESNADTELSKHICELGYDGYAIHDMDTDFEGKFHDEFMICNIDGIEYVEMVSDKTQTKSIIENSEMYKEQERKIQPKKSRKRRDSSKSPVGAMPLSGFSDSYESPVGAIRFPTFSDSPESPVGTIPLSGFSESPKTPPTKRRLFGGKKNSTRKRNKSRKH